MCKSCAKLIEIVCCHFEIVYCHLELLFIAKFWRLLIFLNLQYHYVIRLLLTYWAVYSTYHPIFFTGCMYVANYFLPVLHNSVTNHLSLSVVVYTIKVSISVF